MGKQITPKMIVERHKEYPQATEKLIESYAFQEYQKAIKDLFRFGKVVKVESTDVTLIVISDFDFKEWKDLQGSHWYINNKINLPD